MAKDKFSAVWVSHSSMRDYLNCPRSYYLRAIYKDPKNKHKVTLMEPALALGQAVHDVIESLSELPVEIRLKVPLLQKFDVAWENVTGKKGGFSDYDEEMTYKNRGKAMLQNVTDHPGPILNKAVKIKEELPYYWLSEEDNIILCGKIDWIEYLPQTDAVHIVDFKTGKKDEDPDSLQLPIYYLLTSHAQARHIEKMSYWYIEREPEPKKQELPDVEAAQEKILKIARKMKLARTLGKFDCPQGEGGCRYCRKLERVVKGEGTLVGVSQYHQDIYILQKGSQSLIL
mgnify:CR=1 FL=1